MGNFLENVAGNLQQQIGQKAAEHAGQIAVMQAQFQEELEKRDERIKELEAQLAGEDVVEAEAGEAKAK